MGYEVTIEPLNTTIKVKDGQTILDAALRSGVFLPYTCGHGLCGTCKVNVIKGDVVTKNTSSYVRHDEGKCLVCCAIPESDLVIEAGVVVEPDASNMPVTDFKAVVSKIEEFSSNIKGVFLAIIGKEINFQAGQYINLNIPRLEGSSRPFSIASPPSENHLVELNVALVPNGEGTLYLHEELKVGDEVVFSGPYGQFFVRESISGPLILLAEGSGLSSHKSIILDLIIKGDEREVTLVYGARNQQELYYRKLFEELEKKHHFFTYIPVVSEEPKESNWNGFRGQVNDVLNVIFKEGFQGYHTYICGPSLMVDACVETLLRGRALGKNIFMERFLTTEDGYSE